MPRPRPTRPRLGFCDALGSQCHPTPPVDHPLLRSPPTPASSPSAHPSGLFGSLEPLGEGWSPGALQDEDRRLGFQHSGLWRSSRTLPSHFTLGLACAVWNRVVQRWERDPRSPPPRKSTLTSSPGPADCLHRVWALSFYLSKNTKHKVYIVAVQLCGRDSTQELLLQLGVSVPSGT